MMSELKKGDRTFIATKRDELGGQFTLHEKGELIDHSEPFGKLVVGFNENNRIVDIEIYKGADEIVNKDGGETC